jgi:hypothetical protein
MVIIKKKKDNNYLMIFPIWYLSVRIILARRGLVL